MKFKSIATRIIWTVVPVVLLMTILTVASIFSEMNRQVSSQIDERMHEALGSATLNIRAELLMNANIARSLAIYAGTADRQSIDSGELAAFLLKTIPSNKNTVGGGIWYEPYALDMSRRYFGPYVFVRDGEAVYAPEYSASVDYHGEAWYLGGKASGGEIVWSGVYYDPVAEVTMITASAPFYAKDGAFQGVTTADMSMDDIAGIAASISVGRTGKAFILGPDGAYITFLDGSRSIEARITEDEDPQLRELGAEVLAHGSGQARLTWDGTSRKAFYDRVEGTDWRVVVMIDQAEIDASAGSIILPMAIMPVLTLVLAVAAILAASTYLRRVTGKVNRFADRAAAGDLRERIEITETDEFGVMEDRLNRMMDNMAEMSDRSENALAIARSASRAKTDFLSRMSHEMRTPMNAILGMVQVAAGTDDEARVRECLARIDTAAQSLLALINNVLDMAKINADDIELESAPLDVRRVFDSILLVFGQDIAQKRISMALQADESVPARVLSDPLRYEQVLMNLVSNAIKFTPEGGRVQVGARAMDGMDGTVSVMTEVVDSGIGIDPMIAGRLFDSFEQGEGGMARRFGGSGLGLAISKRLVELMGGTIGCAPAPDGGSRFHFTIVARPMDQASPAAEAETDESGASGSDDAPAAYDFTGRRILLAEDVEINRDIVALLLEGTGVELEFAENGAQAVSMYTRDPDRFDLIFMDIQMPEMDGLTATMRIRETEGARRVPIVAMSANAFAEDISASLAAGMDGHIAKPIDQRVVLGTLGRLFGQAHGARQGTEKEETA